MQFQYHKQEAVHVDYDYDDQEMRSLTLLWHSDWLQHMAIIIEKEEENLINHFVILKSCDCVYLLATHRVIRCNINILSTSRVCWITVCYQTKISFIFTFRRLIDVMKLIMSECVIINQ